MYHLITGIITFSLGVAGLILWWKTFGMVMRGVVPFCLILFGLTALATFSRKVLKK